MASLILLAWGAGSSPLRAETPETAPPALLQLLADIETAANQQDIGALMQRYSRAFAHEDGWTYRTFRQSVERFWKQYPSARYETKLLSWETDGKAWVAETETRIVASGQWGPRETALESTLRSRQRYEGEQVIYQEILSESSQIVSGSDYPQVSISVPETVAPGSSYTYEALVEQPLNENLLFGTAMVEPVETQRYANTAKTYALELLPAGGLFKAGEAPSDPQDVWLSSILIWGDGWTVATDRLHVDRDPDRFRSN